MNAENFVINDCSHREAIETLDELFPELKAVSSFAFIVETVNSVN